MDKDKDTDKDEDKYTCEDKEAHASRWDTRPKRPYPTLGYDAQIVVAQKENARPPSFLPRDTWASAIDVHI